MSKQTPQQFQYKFEKWRELYLQQVEAQQRWLEAEALFDELKEYYLGPDWMADRDKDLDIEYSGEAESILSEDGLWDMISDRNELAIQWMRLGLDALDSK